jgi:hypothetical protein
MRSTQAIRRIHTHDTLSGKEVKALRELLQEWPHLKRQLNHPEVATSGESVTLQEKRRIELNPKATRILTCLKTLFQCMKITIIIHSNQVKNSLSKNHTSWCGFSFFFLLCFFYIHPLHNRTVLEAFGTHAICHELLLVLFYDIDMVAVHEHQ